MNKLIPKFQKGKVIYVSFPDHRVQTDTPLGKQPLGHAGIMYADEAGHTKYFEYGRYPTNSAYGTAKFKQNDGNWRKVSVPDIRQGEAMEDYIERFKKNFGERVTFDIADSEDISKVQKFIDASANDPKRKAYSWHNFNRPQHDRTYSCGGLAREAFDQGRSGVGEWADNVIDFINPFNFLPTGHGSQAPFFGTKTVKSR